MAIQRTFAMLKPGVLQRRLAGEIIARFEKKGLKLVGMKILTITPELASNHYAEHKEKSFYKELVSYITAGPVLAMAIEGDDAIQFVRKLCGPTDVNAALPGTIRGDYSLHTSINIIHSSDSPESAARELGLFFKDDEIVSWEDGNKIWF
jgi:nucleoside-diphosphate kinase